MKFTTEKYQEKIKKYPSKNLNKKKMKIKTKIFFNKRFFFYKT